MHWTPVFAARHHNCFDYDVDAKDSDLDRTPAGGGSHDIYKGSDIDI